MAFLTRNLRLIVALAIAAALVALPAFAFGQDVPPVITPDMPAVEGPADGLIGAGWQVFWSIVTTAGAAVAGLVTWLLALLWGWLSEKYKHVRWVGFLLRFGQALEDALNFAWDGLLVKLAKAKSPDSPGGVDITHSEAAELGKGVWDILKQRYGSPDALAKLGGRVLGGDVIEWAESKVTERVIDAIDGQKDGRPGPRRDPSRPSTRG